VKERNGVGKNSTSSLVRTRRWIRERICVSDTAKLAHHEHIDKLISTRSLIESSLLDKKRNFESTLEYEKDRVITSDTTIQGFLKEITDSYHSFCRYKCKLLQMRLVSKSYYVEIVVLK
jgi:hypothetical protein